MTCRTGCPTQDHANWGECARAARIGLGSDVFASRQGPMTQKAWDRELEFFRGAAEQGVVPDGTRTQDVREALDFSDRYGKPYQGQRIDAFIKETDKMREEGRIEW